MACQHSRQRHSVAGSNQKTNTHHISPMNHILCIIIGALLFAAIAPFIAPQGGRELFANAITAINITPKGRGTRLADASFTVRYLLAKAGSDASHIAICDATSKPLAVVPDMTPTTDQANSDLSYPLPINVLGLNEDTERMVASGVIAVDDVVAADAGGKVRTLPTAAGAYYVVGRALTASTGNNDLVEVAPTLPYLHRVGVGYALAGVGDGGAVAQITTSATGVTLNTFSGQITTVALTTAAGAEERFTVTNSKVAAGDTIALGSTYNGAGTPMLGVVNVAAGAFDLVITNLHAAAALNAALVANFAVIKAQIT